MFLVFVMEYPQSSVLPLNSCRAQRRSPQCQPGGFPATPRGRPPGPLRGPPRAWAALAPDPAPRCQKRGSGGGYPKKAKKGRFWAIFPKMGKMGVFGPQRALPGPRAPEGSPGTAGVRRALPGPRAPGTPPGAPGASPPPRTGAERPDGVSGAGLPAGQFGIVVAGLHGVRHVLSFCYGVPAVVCPSSK